MTLQEILKSKGLSDEDITSIVGEMKQNKIFTAGEENLDLRYGKLKTDHDALVAKDAESQKLIANLQKATADQESIQTQITEYKNQIEKQQEELTKVKTENALKVGLLEAGAKASDIDYLIFKMGHDWKPELDADGKVKGLEDKLKGMKTQYPGQFEDGSNGAKKIEEKKLDDPDNPNKITQEQFKKMGYKERVKLFNENPEAYNELTKEN